MMNRLVGTTPKRRRWVPVASALLLCAAFDSASAGLLGDAVNVTRNYPTITTVESDLGDHIVTPGVEYPSWSGLLSIDVSADKILFTALQQFGFVNGPFNGFVLTDLSHVNITGVSVDSAATTAFGSGASLSFDSTHVFIDMEWTSFMLGGTVSINVTTAAVPAVPEPSTYVLTLAGLTIVGFFARVRRRS